MLSSKCLKSLVIAMIIVFPASAQENSIRDNNDMPFTTKANGRPAKVNEESCLPGIISYWKLDETLPGNYADYAGTNNAKSSSAPVPTIGKVGSAQLFNGSTSKIEVPQNTTIDFTNNSSFSIEFWYKGSSVPSTAKCAVGRYIPETGARWFVGLNASNGKAIFYMSSGGSSASVIGTPVADGSWHYIAASRNGAAHSMKIYVDGILKGTTTGLFTGNFSSKKASLNIGWLSFQNAFTLNGVLDEAAIYNVELSQFDILQHYKNGLAGLGYCDTKYSAPFITSTPVLQAVSGKPYAYKVEATGYPAPVYHLLTFPAGMTIDSITGLIKWLPPLMAGHSVLVKVEASNNNTPASVQTFFISLTGTISYWNFDETIQGNYKDIILDCDATAIIPPEPVPGKIDGAQYFNGFAKADVRKNVEFYNFGANEDFSIEFWYKGSVNPSNAKSVIGRYLPDINARWFVGLNAQDGNARFYMSSGNTSAAVTGSRISDGNWHYIAATRNGITHSMKIYVDGLLKGNTYETFTTDFSSNRAYLNIGWLSFQNAYTIEGTLDEIAIYNIELSLSDIQKHYSKGLTGIKYLDDQDGTAIKNRKSIALETSDYITIPTDYNLFQNYPNPFNPSTTIKFSLPEPQQVTIKVYNQLGEEVAVPVNEYYNMGSYETVFNASKLSSGIYFYKMEAGKFVSVKKLLLLK